jgi:hypothetical protein
MFSGPNQTLNPMHTRYGNSTNSDYWDAIEKYPTMQRLYLGLGGLLHFDSKIKQANHFSLWWRFRGI